MLSPWLSGDGLGTVNELRDLVMHSPRIVVDAGHTRRLYNVLHSVDVINACHVVIT